MTTIALATLLSALGLPQPAALFSDYAVFQRDIPLPVFGAGLAGTPVEVKLGNQMASTVVAADGTWIVRLKPMHAGGSFELEVNGMTVARHVTFGEVWVASGQSNMQFGVGAGRADQTQNALNTPDPDLRSFTVPDISLEEPAKDVAGQWQATNRDTVMGFSAVGYWFARTLREKLNVPVGIIHTSWGGTPAESWTSREKLLKSPNLKHMVQNYLEGIKDYDAKRVEYDRAMAEFTASRHDNRNEGQENGWAKADFVDSSWKSVSMPTSVETIEGREVDGAFWFRRSFEVPEDWAGKALTLELGPIDDTDVTYINGVEVGRINETTPNSWTVPRVYRLAPGTVRGGVNTIAVRVFDGRGGGGFTTGPSGLRLTPPTGNSLDLSGKWRYKVERIATPEGPVPSLPMGPGNPWAPGSLYNGMIAPLIPYGIRGAIWYQGESNAGRAYQYRELFPTMIQDWRERWKQGDFPFYFVQLANYMGRNETPVESAWAELREAQTMTLSLRNTGMATAIDIGEGEDIHPRNKQDVGLRLAYNALAKTYRLPVVATGPMYRSMKVSGDAVTLSFVNGKGLHSADSQPIVGFSLAGADHKFYWAKATIVGDTLVLSAPEVPKPVAVRYAWADNPATNLVNGAGLPTVPFRTDAWPGVTINNK